jgi:hypothetical protein
MQNIYAILGEFYGVMTMARFVSFLNRQIASNFFLDYPKPLPD